MRERAKGSILFGLFVGAVGRSASLPLSGRLGRQLDCRPSYRRSGIDGWRGRCWLLFYPQFALSELTQRTLGSKPHLDETDIFSNWQKGHSFSKNLGPIGRSPRGHDLHSQCKSRCYLDRQWQKHRVFWPKSCWYSFRSWPERWITWKASHGTRSGHIKSWRLSSICRLFLSAFGSRRWSGPTRWIAWPYPIDLRPYRWGAAGIDFWLWGY